MNTYFYSITSLGSGRSYVGQTEHPQRRLTNHLAKKGGYYRQGHTWAVLACLVAGANADEVEQQLIAQHQTLWPYGDNKCPGGKRGYVARGLSEAGKAAQRENATGNQWCVGRSISEATRAKMRAAKLNKYKPGEHPLSGRKKSPEHVAKMRARMLGKPAWNKGIPQTEEQKRKNSESKKGKVAWNKGKAWSEEVKAKIRAGRSAGALTP